MHSNVVPLFQHLVWDFSVFTKMISEDFGGSRKEMQMDIWYNMIEGNEENQAEYLSCLSDTNTTVPLERSDIEKCVLEWADESHLLSLEYAYHNTDGSPVKTGDYLDQDYYEKIKPVIRRQMAAGAVRFAALLNNVMMENE